MEGETMVRGRRLVAASRLAVAVLAAVVLIMVGPGAHAQRVTLEIVAYWSAPATVAALRGLIDDYNAAHPNVEAKFTYIPFGELLSRVLTMAAVKRLPPVVVLDNPDVPRAVKAGFLRDLTPEVSAWPEWPNFYPGPKNAVTVDRRVYGIPVGSNSLTLFYNERLFREAGLTRPPETWSELIEYASRLTKPPVFGVAFSARNTEEATWQWLPLLWSNGGSLLDLSSPKAADALRVWVELVSKGYASRDVVNWGQGHVGEQFIAGRAAMIIMGPWMLPTFVGAGIDFGIAPIPVPAKGTKVVVPLGGEVWTVPKTSPATEKLALDFVFWSQERGRVTKFTLANNYVSSNTKVATVVMQYVRELRTFVEQMGVARARTEEGGANYPQISLITRAAIQKALTGTATPEAALREAAEEIRRLGR